LDCATGAFTLSLLKTRDDRNYFHTAEGDDLRDGLLTIVGKNSLGEVIHRKHFEIRSN
jgi:hypothetical protein